MQHLRRFRVLRASEIVTHERLRADRDHGVIGNGDATTIARPPGPYRAERVGRRRRSGSDYDDQRPSDRPRVAGTDPILLVVITTVLGVLFAALGGWLREGATPEREQPVIHTNTKPPPEIPDLDITSFVLEHAAEHGDKPALIDGPSGRELSYAALVKWIRGLRRRARRPGLREGRRARHLHAERARVRGRLPRCRLGGRHVEHGQPALHGRRADPPDERLRARASCSPSPRSWTSPVRPPTRPGSRRCSCSARRDGATPFTELLGDPADAPEVEIDPATDLAVLPYSSGTTGLSKGVMLTHRNLVANIVQTASQLDVRDDDVFMGALPFFHIYGMTVIMNLGLRDGGDDRDHAAVRPRAVPRPGRGLSRQPRVHRAADRPGARQAPGRRGARPLIDPPHQVRRRTARPRAERAARRAARHVREPGLRADRDQPRHPRDPVRARRRAGRLDRAAGSRDRVPDRRSRNRRGRDRGGRARRTLDARPPDHERLPQQPRGDRRDHRRGRLAALRRRRRRRLRRLLPDRRSPQGADQVQGLPGRARRARGADPRPRARRRRRRRSASPTRRPASCRRRSSSRPRTSSTTSS